MEDLKSEANGRLIDENFIEITYVNNINSNCITTSPELISWYISEFSNYGFTAKIDFSNPLYVSSGDFADEIKITIKNPYVF